MPQLKQALEMHPDLRDGLIAYAATHLSTIPSDTLEVLGINDDE